MTLTETQWLENIAFLLDQIGGFIAGAVVVFIILQGVQIAMLAAVLAGQK